jgi:excisionase family DNA binding protein
MTHGPTDGGLEGGDPEPLWDANDVAAYLKVSRSWVYHRSESGELPCLRVGGLVRFEPEQVREYARGRKSSAATVVALRKR